MDKINKRVILGLIVIAVITVTLYAYLEAQQQTELSPLDKHTIQNCRDLMRESADILVQVARGIDNTKDAQRLQEMRTGIVDIESKMTELQCLEYVDSWAYGSFKQEMVEYEEYIAELVRNNEQK